MSLHSTSTSQQLNATAPSFHPRKRQATSRVTPEPTSSSPSATTSSGSRRCARNGSTTTKSTSTSHHHHSKQHDAQGKQQSKTTPPPPPFSSNHIIARIPRWYGATSSKHEEGAPSTSKASPIFFGGCAEGNRYAFDLQGLSREVLDFVEYARLTPSEDAIRQELIAEVQNAVDVLWDGSRGGESCARVRVYGSYALGVSLPMSDVDIAVEFPSLEDADGNSTLTHFEAQARLYELAKAINCASSRYRATVIDQCRVPVIHVQDSQTTASGDVSMTIPRLKDVVARQKQWLARNPVARPLIMATKAALKQWGLNSSFSGGLSSTCVYLLVQRFLEEMPCDADAEILQKGVDIITNNSNSQKSNSESFDCISPAGMSSPESGVSRADSPCSSGLNGGCMLFPSELNCPSTALSTSPTTYLTSPISSNSDNSHESAVTTEFKSTHCSADDVDDAATTTTLHNISPQYVAKRLLDLWRYCGHECFSKGYELHNVFLPTEGMRLAASMEDLSRGAFRLGEVHVLLRHSVAVLVQLTTQNSSNNMFGFGARPASVLSAILADPRVNQVEALRK